MSDNHHKSSFTDILFFVAIIAVVLLALGADSKFLSGIGKTVAALFR
jgi:hypothetical protein